MAYQELIKNFERTRAYMRDFYIYGFKSRSEYDRKSARSYDDEKRRIESWLGEHMHFRNLPGGKRVFLSIDSRAAGHNPLYHAWRAKSFTDGDITLHFLLFDILHAPDVRMSLSELLDALTTYSTPAHPVLFDESTVRKKLKEYIAEGLITSVREGRHLLFSRTESIDLAPLADVLDFYSEAAPVGVVGQFLNDKLPRRRGRFTFKHHYITRAMDSDILAILLAAMQEGRFVTADTVTKRSSLARQVHLLPLRIYTSAQSGRQYLIAENTRSRRISRLRLDFLSHVEIGETCAHFSAMRERLAKLEPYMFATTVHPNAARLDRVEIEIAFDEAEPYILRRLAREGRGGRITRLSETRYLYTCECFDATEMLPWIRTLVSHIARISCSRKSIEESLRRDFEEMLALYDIPAEGGNDA